MKIEAGKKLNVQFEGQNIIVYGQPDGDDITLLSAKVNGKVTGNSVQLIGNITDNDVVIDAKMNSNYFVMTTGMALGVRCGLDEWSVPRQSAWWYYALMKDGQTEVGMDNNFWYTHDQVVFTCSPAMILLKDGKDVTYVSPSAGKSKAYANTQSMLIRTTERFAFAICTGKMTVDQCRKWAKTIDGIQDLCLMDSGGSTCIEINGAVTYGTSEHRKVSNVLAFYHKKKGDNSNMGKTLKGIDISNWQKGLNLNLIPCDFVIVKATEGVNYVDPCCDKFFQKAKSIGRKLGFYHFARPELNSAFSEANYFYTHTKNYFGQAIPILDWESSGKWNVKWAKEWLDKVYALSGVRPMIYMSESVVNAYNWSDVVAGNYGLWVAKYKDNQADWAFDMTNAGTLPKVKWWKQYAMWQWTSSGRFVGYNGNIDCDIFYGDVVAWDAYVKSSAVPKPEKPQKTIDDLAQEVIAGKWGSGWTRQNALEQAGYDYNAVQNRVNEILADQNKIKVGDTVEVINPVAYGTNRRFNLYYKKYKVMELNGDRAVIGVNGVVTASIDVKNLRKVGA